VQRGEGLEVDESKCASLVSAQGLLDLETDSDDDLLHLFLGLQVLLAVCSLCREIGCVGCMQGPALALGGNASAATASL
jgi:hypothetical protein